MDPQSSGLLVATVHPTELVEAGTINKEEGIAELRAAIPPYCFKPSYLVSFFYLVKDLASAAGLLYAATFIPLMDHPYLRYLAYAIYGFIQGLVATGLWVIAHECGHSAFSRSPLLNDTVGWILHSTLLTPYMSWKSSHARHHIYAGHMDKDMVYVPLRRNEYAEKIGVSESGVDNLVADVPVVIFFHILLQQVVGWPWYLLTNITAGSDSLGGKKTKGWYNNSHLDPFSSLFRKDELRAIFLSDVGLAATLTGLWKAGQILGPMQVFFLYGVPYMWVNHWIVAITYLHHTHPSLPKYEDDSWTFLKGALATVDRDFGIIGRYFFHNVIEDHVTHHLFSRIPFYHAPVATAAIIPLLGNKYHKDQSSFIGGLWQSFTQCQWVEPDLKRDEATGEENAVWYRQGPSPAPELRMRIDPILDR